MLTFAAMDMLVTCKSMLVTVRMTTSGAAALRADPAFWSDGAITESSADLHPSGWEGCRYDDGPREVPGPDSVKSPPADSLSSHHLRQAGTIPGRAVADLLDAGRDHHLSQARTAGEGEWTALLQMAKWNCHLPQIGTFLGHPVPN